MYVVAHEDVAIFPFKKFQAQLVYQIVLPIQSKTHHRLQHQIFQDDADPEKGGNNQNKTLYQVLS